MADLDFDRAESGLDGAGRMIQCSNCRRPIVSASYEAGGHILCPPCKGELAALVTDKGQYLKALAYGVGGAAVGTIIYFAVAAITGFEIGLVAILVGGLVGRGISKDSGGVGGQRYQLTAVFLTYVAISLSYGGLIVKEIASNATPRDTVASADSLDDRAPAPNLSEFSLDAPDSAAAVPGAPADSVATAHAGAFGLALGALFVPQLTLPLLVAFSNLPGSLIGLLIVGYGLWQAWKMNGKPHVVITGPFAVGDRPRATSDPVPDARP